MHGIGTIAVYPVCGCAPRRGNAMVTSGAIGGRGRALPSAVPGIDPLMGAAVGAAATR